jgi:alpha-N-arabinofuranosidase
MRRIASLMATAAVALATPATAQDTINGAIRADQPGPVLSRHIQGQFAEHLGRDIYDGIWVGPDSAIPTRAASAAMWSML